MTEVRIVGTDPDSYSGEGDRRFAGKFGEITGVSGQFVKVRITHDHLGNAVNDPYEHLFLPGELSTR